MNHINKTKQYNEFFKSIAINANKIRSEGFKSTGKIFPSSAGTGCEVKLMKDFVGEDKESDFVWHGAENVIGDAIHAWLQKNLKMKFGALVEIEKYVKFLMTEEFSINSKIDVLINNDLIIEIKTVKSTEGKEPDSHHIKQVQWYMGITGKKRAIISYFNRENGIHISSFEIEFDHNIFDKIHKKFMKIITGAKNLIPDVRECKFCPYKAKCSSYQKPSY